jgi:DNA-binding NarL/FixJ family response regulator
MIPPDPSRSPTRILIADDHLIVRMGFVAMIALHPDLQVVAQAADGQEAIDQYRKHQPDIVLMDLRMPHKSGVEATTQIRKEFPGARVVMLTTYAGDEDIYRALQAGAQGYLTKEIAPDDLITAIRTVMRGEQFLPTLVRESLAARGSTAALTARELEALTLLAKGFSNREIGDLLGCSERTAKFHVENIIAKLEVSDRTEAVSAAFERGILHPALPSY